MPHILKFMLVLGSYNLSFSWVTMLGCGRNNPRSSFGPSETGTHQTQEESSAPLAPQFLSAFYNEFLMFFLLGLLRKRASLALRAAKLFGRVQEDRGPRSRVFIVTYVAPQCRCGLALVWCDCHHQQRDSRTSSLCLLGEVLPSKTGLKANVQQAKSTSGV